MTEEPLPFQPLVIVGAGRSGTNALRDALTRLPEFATWPCDEINPIWRHGNISYPNDAIPPERAHPATRRFIRAAFKRIWRHHGHPDVVVEKTCANSLRVPFVHTVLPEAKFIHLVRDGVDVVASAQKRWEGKLEVPAMSYFLAKARFAPLRDLPVYGLRFLKFRLAKFLGQSKQLSSWGPVFPGMDTFRSAPLDEMTARQWVACVESSRSAFEALPKDQVFVLRYEDFVQNPAKEIGDILSFLGREVDSEVVAAAVSQVRNRSVGKGGRLGELPAEVSKILAPTLKRFDYLK